MTSMIGSCHDTGGTSKLPLSDNAMLVALAGNPNTGKSTVFNALTGLRQHTGNWPGKTIEKKEGEIKHDGHNIRLVDLPGAYSLSAVSAEEVVTRDFLINGKPEAVVVIADATCLERNMYLLLQILEFTGKTVVALNLMDQLKGKGIKINLPVLSAELGIPVVPTIASKKSGLQEVVQAALELGKNRLKTQPAQIDYGPEIEGCIAALEPMMGETEYPVRWLALKLLENDEAVIQLLEQSGNQAALDMTRQLVAGCSEEPELLIAEKRFEHISQIAARAVEHSPGVVTITEKIDRVVTGRVLGLPVLALTAIVTLWLIYNIAAPVGEWIEAGFKVLIDGARSLLSFAPWWVQGIIVDGVLTGIQQIFVYLFAVLVIFFMIYGILEDTGYLARGAFVVDRLLRFVGLPGKAFMTLFASYGCNIPAVMGTRIIDDEHERIIAAAVTPLIPCGARIAVITAVVPVFFGYGWEATLVTLFLFLVSMLAVAVVARLLRKTAFKNQQSSLVLEMPDYRLPSPVNVLRTTATRTYSSMKNALILFPPFAVVIWALFNLPQGAATADTIGMQIATVLAPAGIILGLGGKELMSFIFAFPAKELTLLFLGLIYAGGSTDISAALASTWTPLQAIAFLVFLILYSPCLGTIAALSKEVGWKWTFRITAITLAAGFSFTIVIYWGGVLLGLG